MNGLINGGWDYVNAAYSIVWFVLISYGIFAWKQSRPNQEKLP